MHSIQNKLKFLIIRKIAPVVIKAASWFRPAADKTLLIIKNDGIGDYILFRNFLSFLKQSEKYKGYKIYLLGNIAFKDLATHLDSDTVNGFFWYADGYFLKWKLLKLLADLQRLRLDTILYVNYSRKNQVDWIVKNVKASNKIGVDGDTVNQAAPLKLKSDSYYSRLIKMPPTAMRQHEFEKNKQLCEVLTEQTCNFRKPFIDKQQLNIVANNNIVIFIGASDKNRRWANRNYSELSNTIISKLNMQVVLAGGADEMPDGLKIAQDAPTANFTNKTGQLSLVQLCELIGGAKLIVSGDTVAIHIAAALAIPAVCISKGDLYQRFIPYPDDIENSITTVFPPDFKADVSNYNNWSTLNINSVQLNDVYNAIESTLNRYYPVTNASS
jgi:ADP-heptose:LPS heptosyltransferase